MSAIFHGCITPRPPRAPKTDRRAVWTAPLETLVPRLVKFTPPHTPARGNLAPVMP